MMREMKAGRELDALVAEKVMGWTFAPIAPEEWAWLDANLDQTGRGLPSFTGDIAAAWEVVEKMDGPAFERFDGYMDAECLHALTASEAAYAICLAALKAVGVEVE